MANPDLPTVTDNGSLAGIERCPSDANLQSPHGVLGLLVMIAGNLNNVARVSPTPGSADAERRERMMKKGGQPTAEERSWDFKLKAEKVSGCWASFRC